MEQRRGYGKSALKRDRRGHWQERDIAFKRWLASRAWIKLSPTVCRNQMEEVSVWHSAIANPLDLQSIAQPSTAGYGKTLRHIYFQKAGSYRALAASRDDGSGFTLNLRSWASSRLTYRLLPFKFELPRLFLEWLRRHSCRSFSCATFPDAPHSLYNSKARDK